MFKKGDLVKLYGYSEIKYIINIDLIGQIFFSDNSYINNEYHRYISLISNILREE
jgi:hypothetical protein